MDIHLHEEPQSSPYDLDKNLKLQREIISSAALVADVNYTGGSVGKANLYKLLR